MKKNIRDSRILSDQKQQVYENSTSFLPGIETTQNNKLFVKLANFLPETVFATDTNGTVINLNHVGEKIFGAFSESESRKKSAEQFFTPEEHRRLKKSMSRCQRGSYECLQNISAQKKDGSIFPVQLHLHPIFEDSCCSGVIGIIVDLSSREASSDTPLTIDQKVQTILDHSKDYWGWVLCDFQGNFIDASVDQFKEFNLSKESIVGLSISDFVDKDELEGALHFLQNVKQEGFASGIQHIKMATGEERSYEYKDVAVYENDEPVAVRIIVRDITGKIKNKRVIDVQGAQYQGVFENTGLPTVILEENMLISMVNAKFEEFSGYSKSDIEEKMSLFQFIDEKTKKRILQHYHEPSEIFQSEYECRVTGRSGITYDMIIRFGNISTTRQMIVSFTDITSRKQTEKALQASRDRLQTEHSRDKKALKASEERYQMIVENVKDFVFEQDLAGNFTFINDFSMEQMGYSKEEMIGMNYRQYTLPEEKDLIENYHREIFRTGNPGKGLQHRVVRKDGSIFYVELISSLMKDIDDKTIGYRGISRNITERKLAENILKESGQHFKEIIGGTPVPTIVFDKNCHIEHWNRACEELTGIQSGDVVGKNKQAALKVFHMPILPDAMSNDFVGDEGQGKPGLAFEKSKIVKNAYEAESFFPHLGNNGKWLFITASLLKNSAGQTTGIIETILDITAMKQAEADLQKSEKKYRDFFENVLDFIFIHDLEGNFIENNARYVTAVGGQPDIIAKSNIKDLIPERFKSGFDDYLKRIRKNGRDEGVIAIQTPEEGIRILEYKNFLVYDENNRPISVLGSAQDITEHIRDKKELRESKERYQMILENVGDYIFEVDLAGSYTFVNDALIKESGYTREELIGMNFRDYTFPEESEMIESYFYGIFATGKPGKTLHQRVIRKNGSSLFIEMVVSLIKDVHDNPIGFRGISRDITERKLAEKNLLKMQNVLEEKVEERTKELQEVNIALEVLLKKREKDKKKFEDKVAYSIKEVLTPHLELLKKTHLDKHQKVYLEILEDNFNEIASPFITALSDNMQKLTRTEIQVINLIKQNKITKEIADLMGVSTRTVETHRDNIRKKFGIKNKKVNLRSFLMNAE